MDRRGENGVQIVGTQPNMTFNKAANGPITKVDILNLVLIGSFRHSFPSEFSPHSELIQNYSWMHAVLRMEWRSSSAFWECHSFLNEQNIQTILQPHHIFNYYKDSTVPDFLAAGIIAPIISNNGTLGYLILGDKDSQQLYKHKDINLIEIVTTQVAIAIEATW